MIIIPLILCLISGITWKLAPVYLPFLYQQQNSLLAYLLAISTLSARATSLGARKIEGLKLTGFALFIASFIFSLKPFYLMWMYHSQRIQNMHLKGYRLDDIIEKTFSDLIGQIQTYPWHYGTWVLILVITMITIYYSWRSLGLAPARRLFLDRSYRVQEGPWKAGFLDKAKINELTRNKTGLPLGLVTNKMGKGKMARYLVNSKKGWLGGHHVVISGSQGGKGVSCVLPAILDHQGPIAVIDIKGELSATTRRYRESLGRKVIILNPFDVVQPSTCHWNPLDYIRPHEFERDVRTIIEGLLEPDNSGNDHFYKVASNILQVAIEVLSITVPREQFNLVSLYDLVCGKDFLNILKRWKEKDNFLSGRPSKIAHAILSAGDDERGSFFTTLERTLSWIGFEKNKNFLRSSSFSIDELLENKIDLFCVIPLDLIESMSSFLRLFTNVVLGTVIRQSGIKNPEEKILLILDEFPRLGAMPQLLNIVTVAAGAGIEAFMVAQDKGAIDAVWGKAADTILGSSATVRVFNLGRTDGITAPWAASMMGDKTIVTRSSDTRQYNQFLQASGTESVGQTKEKLLTSVEIQELDDKKILCFLRGKKPLILERVISYEHPDYKNRLDPNPTLL